MPLIGSLLSILLNSALRTPNSCANGSRVAEAMTWPLIAIKAFALDDYTVAWICALQIKRVAAENMLDELHLSPPQPDHDKNIYTFGRIHGHNVVIICPGDMGTTAASIVATRMEATFRRLRFGLLVGIAEGVPNQSMTFAPLL